MSQLDSFFEHATNLPSIPTIVHELIASLGNDSADLVELANRVRQDQALTVKVLRLANSSRYGSPGRVGSVDDAIFLVGLDAFRTIVIATGVASSCRMVPGMDLKLHWSNSLLVAGIAQAMARKNGLNPEMAFTAGLMHNMGIVILHLATPEQAIGIDKELPKAKPFERAAREREVHGMDHGEAATILAKKWNFPADIQVALAEYPRESGGSDLAVTLRAAACVAAAVEQGCDELTLATALPPEMLLAVKLDSAWLAKQHEKFQQLQEESASLL